MTAPPPSLHPRTRADPSVADIPASRSLVWTNRRVLALARAAWLGIAAAAVGTFMASLPIDYVQLKALHDEMIAKPGLLETGLAQLHVAVPVFAAYVLAVKIIFAGACVGIAVLLFRRKSDEPIVLATSFTLLILGVTSLLTRPALTHSDALLKGPILFLSDAGLAMFFLLCYVFPDGRFVPRWTVWPAALWIVESALVGAMPNSPISPQHWPVVLGAPVLLGVLVTMVYAQVYRYRRVSTAPQRQQTKWVMFGFVIAIAGFLLGMLPNMFATFLRPAPAEALNDMSTYAFAASIFLVMPVAVAVAVLRFRLWDIDLIINRTLVYTALTASLIGSHVLVAGGIGALLRSGFNPIISFVAAGVIATLFAPLRARLQRGINRLMYGERDEPYAVMARLGQRLESTLAPDAVLSVIVQTVTEALKLPYAAIAVQWDAASPVSVEAGQPVPVTLQFPLMYQQETVGRLLVAPRAGEVEFGPSDHRLLDDLARQAGIAVHALHLQARTLRLATDLQHSRERLVATREEERRRL
ncbi:MAG: hypothetical protein DLM70_18610, partial [Chloroflexi bacterium]